MVLKGVAYFDCFSGISGDMVLGALVDAGADLPCDRDRSAPAWVRRLEHRRRESETAVQMKKNRPGVLVTILCEEEKSRELIDLVFRETTTIGVRTYEVRRKTLERESVKVQTPYGEVRMKVARMNGSILNATPEYEDCQRIAAQRDIPQNQVIAAATFAYQKNSQARDAAAGGTHT